MSVMAIWCVFGALLRDNMLMGAFCFMHCNIYNWLSKACTLKTCHWTVMFMFYFEERCHCFRFSSFFIASFLCVGFNQSGGLACQTTDAEDICQRLTAISFDIRVKNSLKYLPLLAYDKRFCRVSVPVYLQFL